MSSVQKTISSARASLKAQARAETGARVFAKIQKAVVQNAESPDTPEVVQQRFSMPETAVLLRPPSSSASSAQSRSPLRRIAPGDDVADLDAPQSNGVHSLESPPRQAADGSTHMTSMRLRVASEFGRPSKSDSNAIHSEVIWNGDASPLSSSSSSASPPSDVAAFDVLGNSRSWRLVERVLNLCGDYSLVLSMAVLQAWKSCVSRSRRSELAKLASRAGRIYKRRIDTILNRLVRLRHENWLAVLLHAWFSCSEASVSQHTLTSSRELRNNDVDRSDLTLTHTHLAMHDGCEGELDGLRHELVDVMRRHGLAEAEREEAEFRGRVAEATSTVVAAEALRAQGLMEALSHHAEEDNIAMQTMRRDVDNDRVRYHREVDALEEHLQNKLQTSLSEQSSTALESLRGDAEDDRICFKRECNVLEEQLECKSLHAERNGSALEALQRCFEEDRIRCKGELRVLEEKAQRRELFHAEANCAAMHSLRRDMEENRICYTQELAALGDEVQLERDLLQLSREEAVAQDTAQEFHAEILYIELNTVRGETAAKETLETLSAHLHGDLVQECRSLREECSEWRQRSETVSSCSDVFLEHR